jgi:signal transduction histidine kinase
MKKIRITFILIFIAIAFPVVMLLGKSFSHLKTGSQYAYKEHAYLVLQMLNQRIYDDLAIEEQRSYSEYRFIRAVPVIGGEEITLSRLAEFPIRSHYAGIIGYFQLDPDGALKTPVLPDGALETIPIIDRDKREQVRDSIQKILLHLGLKNAGKPRSPDRNPSEGILNRIYSQNLKYNKDNLTERKSKNGDDLKFSRRYEHSSQKETFVFDVESAKIRRITDPKMPLEEEHYTEPPEVMEVEIEPFQATFNHQYLVYYRYIWRNNEPFIQGFAVDFPTYLGSLVRNEIAFNPQEQTTLLEFGSKNRPFVIFGKRDKNAISILSVPLQYPLSDMLFTMYLTPERRIPGENMVIWLGFLTFVILAGGLIAVYRLTKSQLALATKRQDFISAVSHELKTPLTAIRMYAEMLQNSWVANDEKRQKYYSLIASETDRLSRLIQNVLNLSKLDRNQWNIQLKKENPRNTLEEFVATYSKNIEKNGFDLTVTKDVCEYIIPMDKDAVMQILMNLVDNSIKFSKDAQYKMIVLELKVEDNDIFFVVRDYGPGIPPSEITKVFDEFYRVENEMTRKTNGTGIGLSMVKKLCSLTNMRIEIENASPGLRTKIHFPPISI